MSFICCFGGATRPSVGHAVAVTEMIRHPPPTTPSSAQLFELFAVLMPSHVVAAVNNPPTPPNHRTSADQNPRRRTGLPPRCTTCFATSHALITPTTSAADHRYTLNQSLD